MNVPRQETLSDYSSEPEPEHDNIAAVAALPGGGLEEPRDAQRELRPSAAERYEPNPYKLQGVATHTDEPRRERAAEAAPTAAVFAGETMPHPIGRTFSEQRYEPGSQQTDPVSTAAPRLTGPSRTDQPSHEQARTASTAAPFTAAAPIANEQRQAPVANEQRQAPVANEQRQTPVPTQTFVLPISSEAPAHQVQPQQPPQQDLSSARASEAVPAARTLQTPNKEFSRHSSSYGDWMTPAAAGVAGAGAGALGAEAYQRHNEQQQPDRDVVPIENDESAFHQQPLNFGGYQPRSTGVPQYYETAPTRAERGDMLRMDSSALDSAETGAAGLGAGILGEEAYRRHQQQKFSPPALTSAVLDAPRSSMSQSTAPDLDSGVSSMTSTPPSSGLGGLEKEGARPTGNLFPSLLRHNTDMSVSALHVPGEFPKGTVSTDNVPATGNRAWEAARE